MHSQLKLKAGLPLQLCREPDTSGITLGLLTAQGSSSSGLKTATGHQLQQ